MVLIAFLTIYPNQGEPVSPIPTAPKPDFIRAAGAVQDELRVLISRWSMSNLERIITSFPTDSLQSLKGFDATANRSDGCTPATRTLSRTPVLRGCGFSLF